MRASTAIVGSTVLVLYELEDEKPKVIINDKVITLANYRDGQRWLKNVIRYPYVLPTN